MKNSNSKHRKNGGYEPTQEDIKLACDKIKAGLSERELAKRRGDIQAIPWLPQVINTDFFLDSDINEY